MGTNLVGKNELSHGPYEEIVNDLKQWRQQCKKAKLFQIIFLFDNRVLCLKVSQLHIVGTVPHGQTLYTHKFEPHQP